MTDKIPYGVFSLPFVDLNTVSTPLGGWEIAGREWLLFQSRGWDGWSVHEEDLDGRTLDLPFEYML